MTFLSVWFDLLQIGQLDSSATNLVQRPRILNLLSRTVLRNHQVVPDKDDLVYWAFVVRKLQFQSISVSSCGVRQFAQLDTTKLTDLTICDCCPEVLENDIVWMINGCKQLKSLSLLNNHNWSKECFDKISYEIKSQINELHFDNSRNYKMKYRVLRTISETNFINLTSFSLISHSIMKIFLVWIKYFKIISISQH
jgi:hypothetical protein